MKRTASPKAYVLVVTSAVILIMSLLLTILLLTIRTDSRRNILYQKEFDLRLEILNKRNDRLNYLNDHFIEDITENVEITVAGEDDHFCLFVSNDNYSFQTEEGVFSLMSYLQQEGQAFVLQYSLWNRL